MVISDAKLLIVIAINDTRRRDKPVQATKDILWVCWISEVLFQFVIDGQIRRNNEKILDTFFIMQIGNASAHQPRLADACCQSKAK